jgi:uncharacterized protein YbgA (DUF1722 family)/uncharacterized protein YbbK (DUF523 family)
MSNEGFAKPRVGISSCLLGEQVRYDGGHKRDRFLSDTFGRFVEWVPVCPEVECGLPIPRESMHLEGDPTSPRLVTTRTHVDHAERMLRWAERRLDELAGLDLCGFIFKTNSPSSGMRGIRVYDEKGVPHKVGVGLFARAFMARFPLLPVEDEGRLHDAGIRENFIERLFALKRYRETDRSVGGLVSFHARHKMQLMAHSQKHLSEMGRLVAHAKEMPQDELFATYEGSLMLALKERATPRKNGNVLMHMMGFFKDALTADEKAEMLKIIGQFSDGLVPLMVPVTLMNHYVRKYEQPYLKTQTYLNPHPVELKLRNHA